MTEVIHYRNRWGRQYVGVILDSSPDLFVSTPAGLNYHERYAAGLEKPYYPVPAIRQHFEFGCELGTGDGKIVVVLLHAIQGVYDG